MKISIFGMGYVGTVSGACLASHGHDIIGVDISPHKVEMINAGISPIVEEGIAELTKIVVNSGKLSATTDVERAVRDTDVSFISVGTPSAANGSLFLDAVRQVTGEIGHALRNKQSPHLVVVRSTVVPGTTEELVSPVLEEAASRKLGDGLDVCFNPEFLREGRSIKDFERPPYTVIGASGPAAANMVNAIYAGVSAPVIHSTVRVAESVKYLSNLYHALKICFANEAGSVLKSFGVDGREAMEIFCQDNDLNISKAYLRPGFAFGGSCLPKDARAFLHLAKSRDIEVPLLANIVGSNNSHIDRAFRLVTESRARRVGLFGLSFKPGTDDLRESPLVTLAERLIGKGYDLRVCDPNVEIARLIGSNREFIEREIPHIGRLMETDPRKVLDHAEVIVIGHIGRAEAQVLAERRPAAPIIDLQGVAEFERMEGLNYSGICW